MNKKYKIALYIILWVIALAACAVYAFGVDIAVLNPKGVIADKQRTLLITATGLMLIVVIPVFVLTFFIAWKYRASNKKAKYSPDWDNSHLAETIWWGVPFMIIIVLGILTWKGSHELDPFRPLESDKKPLTVQVVALTWKWLFIYPEQKIATVNFFQIPEKTPINFEVTSDAPMNSFWIPQLGGQIYAMSGMRSKLHLMAEEPGSYRGVSANLSGQGFSGMTFTAKASSEEEFAEWVQQVQQSPGQLSLDEYNKLAAPSENNPPAYYVLTDDGLFDQIIMKYMTPTP